MGDQLFTVSEAGAKLRRSKWRTYTAAKAATITPIRLTPRGRLLSRPSDLGRALQRGSPERAGPTPA